MTKTTEYLRKSEKWYGFLAELKDVLFEYGSLDSNRQVIGNLIKKCTVNENETRKVSDIGLNQVLAEMRLDLQNLKILKRLLQQTLINGIRSTCVGDELTVKGYEVKISEFKRINCKAKTIEIFALHKVLFDADIDKTGKN